MSDEETDLPRVEFRVVCDDGHDWADIAFEDEVAARAFAVTLDAANDGCRPHRVARVTWELRADV